MKSKGKKVTKKLDDLLGCLVRVKVKGKLDERKMYIC